MANLFRKPSGKTALIAGVTVAILAIIAIAGTAVYLRSKAQTEAVDFDSNQATSQNVDSGNSKRNEEENTNESENQDTISQNTNEETEQTTADTVTSTVDTTDDTVTSGTTLNRTTSNTGNITDRIQSTTITRTVDEKIKTLDGYYVGWKPMDVNAELASTKIDAELDEINIIKSVTTKTGINLAVPGEEITYTLKIRSPKSIKSIDVTDRIPEQTEYLSIENNGIAVDSLGNAVSNSKDVKAVRWIVDITEYNEEIEMYETEVSFKVKANNDASGTIKNTAIANGNYSNEVQTAIINSLKEVEIISEGKENPTFAKLGDELKFTVSLINTGDISGTTTLKDNGGTTADGTQYTGLEKILKDDNGNELTELVGNISIIEVDAEGNETVISSDKTAEQLIAGIPNVNVPANGRVKAVFTVKINKIEGKIVNLGTFGDDKDNPTNPVEVDTADFTIVKEVTSTDADDNGKYQLNEIVTYKVTVTNTGNVTLHNMKIADKLEGIILTSETDTIEKLAPGESASAEFRYKVKETDLGTDGNGKIHNIATARPDELAEKEAPKDVPTEDKAPDFTIVKEVTSTDADNNGKYQLNELVTYKVTVTNTGNVTLHNMKITDKLEGVTLTSATDTIAELTPGESASAEFSYKVKETDLGTEGNGNIHNIATAKPDELAEKEAPKDVPTEDRAPDFTIVKEVTSTDADNNGKYQLNEIVTYKVTVTNTGNVTLHNMKIADKLEGVILTSVTDTIEKLAPGESASAEFSYKVKESDLGTDGNGKIHNIATAKPDELEEKEAPKDVPTEDKAPNFTIVKEVISNPSNGSKYKFNETVKYKVTVTNTGNVTLHNMKIGDKLPGTELISPTDSIAELTPKASASIEYKYVVKETDLGTEGNGIIHNIATAKPDELAEKEAPKDVPTEDKAPDFTIVKNVESKPTNGSKYVLGETVRYKVTVTNTGNITLHNIVISDQLPNVTMISNSNTIAELKPTESSYVEYSYVVKETDLGTNGSGSVHNVATAKPDEVESKTDFKDVPTEDKKPDFTMSKEVTSLPAKNGKYILGETVTYKVIVNNTGNVTLKNIKVTDQLPGITLISSSDTIAELKPTESAYVEYSYIVKKSNVATHNVINVATVSPEDSDGNKLTPKQDNKEVPVDDFNPDVSITKKITGLTVNGVNTSFGNDGVDSVEGLTIGTKITYRIVAKNTGNVSLSNFKVTDTSENRTVYLESVQLPERLNNIQVPTGIQVAGGTNLLGNDNITAEPNDEFTFIVSYVIQREDVTGNNYQQDIVNTAHDEGNYNYKDENGNEATDTPSADDTAEAGTTYTAERGKKEFVKVWDDANYESERPANITIELIKNGTTVVDTQTIDSANGWKYEWEDLPLEEDNGSARITYTVRETIPTGYADKYTQSACTVNNDGQFTITNTYKRPSSVKLIKDYTESTQTTVKVPLDVVFILDTSASMTKVDSGSSASRVANLRDAVNSAITELKKNEQNRISIVGYSDNASLLLGLTEAKNIENNPVKLSDSGSTLSVKGGKSRSVNGGTYTQAGIALGTRQLTATNVIRTVELHDKIFTRVPVIILLSDGLPTYYTTSYNNVDTTGNTGRDGDSISESVEQGYYTVKTAKYYKDQVTSKYRETDPTISAKMYTIGINIGTYGQAVLDPSKIGSCQNSTEVLTDSHERYPDGNTYKAAENFYKAFTGSEFDALVRIEDSSKYEKSKMTLPALDSSYNYADASYSNNISVTDLTKNMNAAIEEATPKQLVIQSTIAEINSAKVYLPDYDNNTTPNIKVNGSDYSYNKSEVIKQEGTQYYVDLTKLPAGSSIEIEYKAK